jgi:hypothetical protein
VGGRQRHRQGHHLPRLRQRQPDHQGPTGGQHPRRRPHRTGLQPNPRVRGPLGCGQRPGVVPVRLRGRAGHRLEPRRAPAPALDPGPGRRRRPPGQLQGLAIAPTSAGTFLYGADFHHGRIDVFDQGFARVHLAGRFQDRKLPRGYAPFNIQELGGRLYVAYAKQDPDRQDELAGPGRGFVDVYSTRGHLLRRLIRRGQLNAPWGLVQAPAAGFGRFSGALLVGNFGDGRINAYDPRTGGFRGRLRHEDGRPIQIQGLWALRFGNGVTGDPTTLLFTAGIEDEAHGLFGAIEAAS